MPIETLAAGFPSGVVAGFTTRWGGVSAGPWAQSNLALHVEDETRDVLANRDALAGELGAPVTFLHQVHGADVLVLAADAETGQPDPPYADVQTGEPDPPYADAVATDRVRTPLAVLVADCVPVLLADPVAGVVAAAHAGRRGLVAGVLQSTVAAMARLGAEPTRSVAAVGPAAGGCCYEVPPQMRDEVAASVPRVAAQTTWGTPSLDLRAGAAAVLRGIGVDRVRTVGGCTIEDANFYSYRRDRTTGRFAGLVMLRA